MRGLFLASEPLPMRSYIFRMALMSIIPSLIVAGLVVASGAFSEVGPRFEKPQFGSPIPVAVMTFLLLVVFSPVVETLLMSFGIGLMSLFTKGKVSLAILSAILWALVHSLASPGWGLIVCWPFFVFSCAYLAWRPQSWFRGVWVALSIHALQNLLPGLLVLIYFLS
jgi:hypothetical protein